MQESRERANRAARAFVAAAILILSGCSKQAAPVRRTSENYPSRIVSLAPGVTEVLYRLGLQDRIVGVTAQCDYPSEAAKKPKIGDVTTNIELVVAARPDLVVAHGFLNRHAIASLQAHGLRVLASDPKTLEDVARSFEEIGEACGAAARGKQAAAEFRGAIQDARERAAGRKTGKKVLFAVQGSPLYAAGPGTFVHEMIEIVGAENAAEKAQPGFNVLAEEAAVSSKPDLIIVTDQPAAEHFRTSKAWRNVPAVRDDKVVVADPDLFLRPGPRLTLGLEKLEQLTTGSR